MRLPAPPGRAGAAPEVEPRCPTSLPTLKGENMLIELDRVNRHQCGGSPRRVPPSPELLTQLKARYNELIKDKRLPRSVSFEDFYFVWRASRRSENFIGLDAGSVMLSTTRTDAPQLIERPTVQLKGVVNTMVLLVDFPDRPHSDSRSAGVFEPMLFRTPGGFLTGRHGRL